MELKDILKLIEREIREEEELYGDALNLTFQSYETYALAVKITEGYFRASGVMTSDSFTRRRLKEELINLAKVCIMSARLIHEGEDEEEEDEEEEYKRRTIGFRVADKSDGYTIEKPPSYPVDTYAIGYEVYDEEDYYDDEEEEYGY